MGLVLWIGSRIFQFMKFQQIPVNEYNRKLTLSNPC